MRFQLEVHKTRTSRRKLTLPQEVLESLSAATVPYPLIFKVKSTHLGVHEFSAPSGTCLLDEELMQQLGINVGHTLDIESIELPKGTSVSLKVSESLDWKPLLESWMPLNCAALSIGDVLNVEYLGTVHHATVESLEPASAVCVLDTNLDLEVLVPGEKTTQINADNIFELGKPYTLSATPKNIAVPSNAQVTVDGVAYFGPQHATSPDSYEKCVAGIDATVIINFDSKEVDVCGEGTVIVDQLPKETENGIVCETCRKTIPSQSYTLHSSVCARRSAKCTTCSALFPGSTSVPQDHWHCNKCNKSGTGFEDFHFKHAHTSASCSCGEFGGSFDSVARHRATDCKNRLVACRFCYLLAPQEVPASADPVRGLNGHERNCGNRTAECPVCRRSVRLFGLEAHMLEHEAAKQDKVAPSLCSNKLCVNQAVDNAKLGLCATCFGPLYSTQNDPDGSLLAKRLERRLVLQLLRGCGKNWCDHQYCATGSGAPYPLKDASALAKQLISEHTYYFCVDEIISSKKHFLDLDNGYDRSWKGAAISRCSTEREAEKWLKLHAPRAA